VSEERRSRDEADTRYDNSLTSGVRDTRAAVRESALRGSRSAERDRGDAAPRDSERRPVVSTAVVLATAPASEARPAAALPWGDETVLRRLLRQLTDVGVSTAHVLTRPEWEGALGSSLEAPEVAVHLHASPDTASDLRVIARLARSAPDGLVVVCGDLVTHREALAGVLADPRIATGILTTPRRIGPAFAFRARSARGRVLSAASPYHAVRGPNARFLGILKVAPEHVTELAGVADRLSALTTPPLPDSWDDEFQVKLGAWRLLLARAALTGPPAGKEALDGGEPDLGELDAGKLDAGELDASDSLEHHDPDAVVLSSEDEAQLERWRAAAPEDAASLLLVGLVRSGVHVGVSHLREFFWARPLSRDAVEEAAERIHEHDEDRVVLESAVKAKDGFFTTFFVSPYSKYLARWAARRGWTPNQVTTVSLGVGLLAALTFATGERAGLIAGAVLVQLAFTLDCVDGQLARYTRTFSQFGAWLDSVFDRTKEYVVFAGLAIGASRSGDPVWLLAGCALALQTVRHMIDFSYPITAQQALATVRHPPIEQSSDDIRPAASPVAESSAITPEPRGAAAVLRGFFSVWHVVDRWPGARWIKKIVAFPIGERFAVISLTAALAGPRTTFTVLLAWGGAAALYKLAGRVLRSISR
jgi:hypothetical protein